MHLPQAYCGCFSVAKAPNLIGCGDQGMGCLGAARTQATFGSLGKPPRLRSLRSLATGSLRPQQDMLRPRSLIQEDFQGLVAKQGPAQTRIRVYTTRQPDLSRGLKGWKQLSPIGLTQSRGQGRLLLSIDHVAPLTGGARAQTRSIRPRVNRRPICHTTLRELVRMKKFRATLKRQRDPNPLLGLIPGTHLNLLRWDSSRPNGLKRESGRVLVTPSEGHGHFTPQHMAGCERRVL